MPLTVAHKLCYKWRDTDKFNMEVSDLHEILNARSIKMENSETAFDEAAEAVEMSDSLSNIINMPQYVTESDLGLMQAGAEIFQTPLAMFDGQDEDDEDTMQSNDSCSGDEIIVQLMDIRTRLSKLRTILERRLGVDLTDYTFWLQDAKMLEAHKTLVEQCIRGSGVVQVNLQIKPNSRKINILDVLKPDDEIRDLDYMEVKVEEAQLQTETAEAPPLSAPEPEGKTHAAAVNWIVDTSFRNDHSRARIPADPMEWSVIHVKLWIQWAVRQFNLTGIKLSDWNISGAALCALSNVELKEKVPHDPGDLFWTHFELLRKCKFIAVVQQSEEQQQHQQQLQQHQQLLQLHQQQQQLLKETQEIDKDLLQTQSAIKKKPKQVHMHSSDDELGIVGCASTNRAGNNGQVQLWQFLLELLTSGEFYEIIRWHGTEGEFKLLEPEKVARLWGARKHKPAMNYEKLSRALRYYYDGDMIAKVPGKRFVYKFVCDLKQLIGYSPGELADLVKEVHIANKLNLYVNK